MGCRRRERRPGPGRSSDRISAVDEDRPDTTLLVLLAPGLRLVVVGINPSRYSVAAGHYSRPANSFWWLLAASGLTDRVLDPTEDHELPGLGIGLTDLVKTPTSTARELPADAFVGVLAGAAGCRRAGGGAVQRQRRIAARAWTRAWFRPAQRPCGLGRSCRGAVRAVEFGVGPTLATSVTGGVPRGSPAGLPRMRFLQPVRSTSKDLEQAPSSLGCRCPRSFARVTSVFVG